MVPAYFIFTIILIVLIYNVSTGNNQFATTASVIRQIWSGRCRSCPHSNYSGLSGLSDTNQGSNLVGPSRTQDCICDSCPCALVENLLIKCSPITTILQETANVITQLLCHLYSVMEDLYAEYTSALECRGTCQAQVTEVDNNDYPPSENYSVSSQETSKREARNVQNKKSNISFVINSDDRNKRDESMNENYKEPINKDEEANTTKNELENKDIGSKIKISHDQSTNKIEPENHKKSAKETSKPKSKQSEETLKLSASASATYCSKCKENNKTCLSSCPKSKK